MYLLNRKDTKKRTKILQLLPYFDMWLIVIGKNQSIEALLKKIDKYFTWEAVCCENCMHGFSESVAVVKQPFDSLPIYRKC